MKIDYLKINGFGKIKNKDVVFDDKLTLIEGDNEAGKTTLLNAIISMLYGANKNKNGKDISIYEKYKPWDGGEFSGKIKYTLDNDEQYEVFREFSKRNPQIYNKNLEDITNKFDADKTKGIDFLYEQTKVDENLFLSTSIVNQESTKLENTEQSNIMQKISNAISTRDDNVSYRKTIDIINKKLSNEVGTYRTSEKPINIIENKIEQLKKEREELINIKSKKDKAIERKLELEKQIEKQEIYTNIIKKIKNVIEKYDFDKDIENLYYIEKERVEEKISFLDKEIEVYNQEKNNKVKQSKNIYLYICIVCSMLSVISVIARINLAIIIPAVVISLVSIILCVKKACKNKTEETKRIKEIDEKIEKRNDEIEEYHNNLTKKLDEIKKLQNQKLIEKNNEKTSIELEYSSIIPIYELELLFKLDYNEIIQKVFQNEEKLNALKLEKSIIEIEIKNANIDIENQIRIEEQIEENNIKKEELDSLSKSISIAKECLEKAYNEMKEKINPGFMKNLSNSVEAISDNKYNNIVFSDTYGLQVELENGKYVQAERLSIGTIYQMYLSLRINILKEITEERMPIILDEAFVYFDNKRLENTLKLLNEKYKNQIIIFTCSKREREILNKLNINYKLVEI